MIKNNLFRFSGHGEPRRKCGGPQRKGRFCHPAFCILHSSLFIFLFSCEPNADNIDLPVRQEYVVLECYLTPGFVPELTLAKSNISDDELILHSLWYADVSLDADGTVVPMQNILYNHADRNIWANYRAADSLRATGHDRFRLSVTTRENEKLSAATGSVPPVHIADCRIDRSRIDIDYTTDGDKPSWLKVGIAVFMGKKKSTLSQYFDAGRQRDGNVVMQWEYPDTPIDSMVVTLFNIQKDYYDYGISIQNAVSAYHDPLMTPETVKSNVAGGIGIFTYYTFDQMIFRY